MTCRGDIVGKTLIARVARIENYGLYLAYEDATILVLIVDVSANSIRDLREAYRSGEEVSVRVLRYIEAYGMYKGEMVDDPLR
ncbi:MAG: S1 RNA-binding domain-containing protein [Myxococcales bacterium]|nr:S1 RNA-binding domain-containing protein [Myxococcales bacterium]